MICTASILSRATIGPPAKRRSDEGLLAGRHTHTHTRTHAHTHTHTHTVYKCRLLITLVNSLDPDQVKSADDKKHRKYPSMQRVRSTVHRFDWKIEHV